ncbi:unnamed protein product [Arctia plantaginis]|uniref:Mutator-like transposase domain-containing protein n=1 Tax=Arctia plantaginis TaxID=874455 RepID=A0A8S1A3S4_ARCPL|nr:unnamed protein product [Arctia plantaginis]
MGNKKNQKTKQSCLKKKNIAKKICSKITRSEKGLFLRTKSTEEQQPCDDTSNRTRVSFITLEPVDLPPSATKSSIPSTVVHLQDVPNATLSAPEPVVDSEANIEPDENNDGLIIEKDNKEDNFQPISGRRIIDINYFLQEFQEKARHNNLFNCQSSNLRLVGERRNGLISTFKFECNMCKEVCLIPSENTKDTEQVNANIAATTGVVASVDEKLLGLLEYCSTWTVAHEASLQPTRSLRRQYVNTYCARDTWP